jgi:hypothetical protein
MATESSVIPLSPSAHERADSAASLEGRVVVHAPCPVMVAHPQAADSAASAGMAEQAPVGHTPAQVSRGVGEPALLDDTARWSGDVLPTPSRDDGGAEAASDWPGGTA